MLQGRNEEAEPLLLQALKLYRSLPPEHIEMSDTLNHLAGICRIQGHYEQAQALCHEALEMIQRLSSKADPRVAIL